LGLNFDITIRTRFYPKFGGNQNSILEKKNETAMMIALHLFRHGSHASHDAVTSFHPPLPALRLITRRSDPTNPTRAVRDPSPPCLCFPPSPKNHHHHHDHHKNP
jgi:hypothetical protein